MPQLSLYLDDDTMEKLRADAKRANLSLSKHVAKLIQESRPGDENGWSERFWETYGSLAGTDFARPEQPDWSLDAHREIQGGLHVHS